MLTPSANRVVASANKPTQHQVAIDTLTYKFDVMRVDPADVMEGPDDGIYCHGLWLEGERTVPPSKRLSSIAYPCTPSCDTGN